MNIRITRNMHVLPSPETRARHAPLIRVCDVVLAAAGLLVFSPLFLLLLVLGWAQYGSPLFLQTRIGKGREPFTLMKFRTMLHSTPSVASHQVPQGSITSYGRWLRRTKCDELPQLWNVLRGDMSFVGPRPCLPNQHDVIAARLTRNCFRSLPGITGAAQIAKIDMSEPERLAAADAAMVEAMCLQTYGYYVWRTACGDGAGDAAERCSKADRDHCRQTA